MKKLIILFFLLYGVVYGQTTTHEKPVSLLKSIPPLTINGQTQKIMPNLDMSSIEKEDEEDRVNGIIPRFGYKHEVSFNLHNSGEWIELPNGDKIWRLSIVCPKATLINILYDKFWIPEGAKLFIYSTDYRSILGAFTSVNSKEDKEDARGYSTGLIMSEQITLEYYVPKEVEDEGVISICDVVHGYRGLASTRGICFNCSNEHCKNVNCYPNFKNEKNAVVVIVVNGNTSFTGSLVNTTANEMHNKHFILTVNQFLSQLPNASYKFYWHYEYYGCTPNQPSNQPPLIYTQGASVVAKSSVGNFGLLELHEDPGLAWDVTPYYLGWDRSGTAPTGSKWIIHHPLSDIKKIVTTTTTLSSLAAQPEAWETKGQPFSDDSPFLGSEGAPLLNSNKKLVGFHWKIFNAYCVGGTCYYDAKFGKFWWAWDNEPTVKLKDWLDPLNLNPTTLEGRGCQKTIKLHYLYPQPLFHAVEKIISKQVIPSGVTTTYKAGEEIVLEDGFHAEAGSTFHAIIEEYTECIPPPRANAPSQNNEQDEEFAFQTSKSQSMQHQFSYELYLHPNPNPGTFQIETNFPLSEISQLKITNTLGLTVYETRNLASNEIQLPNSVSGLYFVVMVLKDGTVLTQKMMVQR